MSRTGDLYSHWINPTTGEHMSAPQSIQSTENRRRVMDNEPKTTGDTPITERLDELERVAQEIGYGVSNKWRLAMTLYTHPQEYEVNDDRSDLEIAVQIGDKRVAKYIATFDPPTVLALIRALRAERARVAELHTQASSLRAQTERLSRFAHEMVTSPNQRITECGQYIQEVLGEQEASQ